MGRWNALAEGRTILWRAPAENATRALHLAERLVLAGTAGLLMALFRPARPPGKDETRR